VLGKIVSFSLQFMAKKQKIVKKLVVVEKAKPKKVKVEVRKLDKKPIPNSLPSLPNVRSLSVVNSDFSDVTAAALIDPFTAYGKQVQVGLPFDPTAQQVFGMWTKDIQVINSVTDSGSNKSIVFAVAPWFAAGLSVASAIGASGIVTAYNQFNSLSTTFIQGGFEEACVSHMGVRVRNLTAVMTQAGEITIGECRFAEWNAANYQARRGNVKSYTRAIAGAQVFAEANWIGMSDSESESTAQISDYLMCDTSGDVFADDLTVTYVQIVSPNDVQIEVEVVRHLITLPTLANQAFIPLTRLLVNPNRVMMLADYCYSQIGRFDMRRSALADDAGIIDDFKSIWKGAKALARLPGSLWQGLTSGLSAVDPRKNMLRTLLTLNPDVYKQLVSHVSRYPDLASALQALKSSSITSEYQAIASSQFVTKKAF